MDPEEVLRRLRALAADAIESEEHGAIISEAHELFQALDEWLTNGGFLPADWHGSSESRRLQEALRLLNVCRPPVYGAKEWAKARIALSPIDL